MATGDTFIIGDYQYTVESEGHRRVMARVVDKTKTAYANLPASVVYAGKTYSITNLNACFLGCTLMTTPPTLPSTVVSMNGTFVGTAITTPPVLPASVVSIVSCFAQCRSLRTAPTIPGSVYDMTDCFMDCVSLTTAPTIPSTVTSLARAFNGCTSLTGEVVINSNTDTHGAMFAGTEKGIWLTGSSSQLQALAATADNGNVFVGEIPLDYSLAAERVGSDGGTTPEAEGNWLHLVASISWSNFSENSIDSMGLTINGTSISSTAYTDATKTEAITLPGWRPAAQAEAHAWIQIDPDTQIIVFSASDTYHTGPSITLAVPQAFRTFDFLAGGKGIAAGARAEEEGFHFAMEPFFRTLAGVIQMFAGSTLPNGWLLCDGSEQLISDYPELYAAIEDAWGTPSDSNHFVLPDFQDRFPVGAGNDYAINAKGGEAEHKLEIDEMPSHNHTQNQHRHEMYGNWSTGSGSTTAYMTSANRTATTRYTDYTTPTINNRGGGQPHENRPPFLGVNFIIHTGRPTISA